MTSHIAELDAFERSKHYRPFYMLPEAAKALHYRRIEVKAAADLDDMGGPTMWPDLYDVVSDEYHMAREKRGAIIAAYLAQRPVHTRSEAA
jgi:hypothetical protein